MPGEESEIEIRRFYEVEDFGAMVNTEVIAGLLTIFIVIAVFLVAVVRAADAETRAGQDWSVIAILVLAALLPAWGSFIYLFVNSFNSTSRDFWSAVVFTMVVVTFVAGIPFLFATGISAVVYMFADGEHLARLKLMVISLCVTGALAIAYAALTMSRLYAHES